MTLNAGLEEVALKMLEKAGKEALEMRDSKGDSSLRGEAAPAHAGSAPQNGAAGSAPSHMTPCARATALRAVQPSTATRAYCFGWV